MSGNSSFEVAGWKGIRSAKRRAKSGDVVIIITVGSHIDVNMTILTANGVDFNVNMNTNFVSDVNAHINIIININTSITMA